MVSQPGVRFPIQIFVFTPAVPRRNRTFVVRTGTYPHILTGTIIYVLLRRSFVTRTIFRALAALAIVFAFGLAPAAAQTGQMFGELVGKVVDDQGGVLPGVTVTLSGTAAMWTRTAVSNEQGRYRFPAVNSGTYTLKFELAGFAPMLRAGIGVAVRHANTRDH